MSQGCSSTWKLKVRPRNKAESLPGAIPVRFTGWIQSSQTSSVNHLALKRISRLPTPAQPSPQAHARRQARTCDSRSSRMDLVLPTKRFSVLLPQHRAFTCWVFLTESSKPALRSSAAPHFLRGLSSRERGSGLHSPLPLCKGVACCPPPGDKTPFGSGTTQPERVCVSGCSLTSPEHGNRDRKPCSHVVPTGTTAPPPGPALGPPCPTCTLGKTPPPRL